jgi:type IV pilus assembly protein PilA
MTFHPEDGMRIAKRKGKEKFYPQEGKETRMLSMLKMKNRKGFTLIELMIVVAIIGILAAIAIPNFLKFQAKSKQSEAKTNLKAIYTAETGYYGENNTYNTFDRVNWAPVGTSRYAYSLGTDNGIATPTPGPGTSFLIQNTSAPLYTDGSFAASPARLVGSTSFLAGAVGNIDNDTPVDEWTINDNNSLVNTANDV